MVIIFSNEYYIKGNSDWMETTIMKVNLLGEGKGFSFCFVGLLALLGLLPSSFFIVDLLFPSIYFPIASSFLFLQRQ